MKENIEEIRKLLTGEMDVTPKRAEEYGIELNPLSFISAKSDENMTTLTAQIAEKLTEEEKEEIQDCLKIIEDKPKFDKKSISRLFQYWHKYIKNQKQSLRCSGCRKAVHQFWKRTMEECNKE